MAPKTTTSDGDAVNAQIKYIFSALQCVDELKINWNKVAELNGISNSSNAYVRPPIAESN